MQLNITITLEDNYIDEGDIASELKRIIKSEIVHALKSQISEKAFEQISIEAKKVVTDEMGETISAKIKEVVNSQKLKPAYGNSDITLEDFIINSFTRTDLRSALHSYIEKEAGRMITEMKKSYDLTFASHIVKNMQANNLLKDGVADLLFNK